MKLMYRCMFDDHPPSEADLAQWQNFDQLLSQYHYAKQAKTKMRRWWYGTMILTALILTGKVAFYFLDDFRTSDSIVRIAPLPPQLSDMVNPLNYKHISSQVRPIPLPEKKAAIATENTPSNSSTASQVKRSQFEEAHPTLGYPALYEYFATNLKYPEAARREQAEGTVLVEFYINEEGRADRVQILQGVQEDINQEAIRLIQSMPLWSPARVNSKAVATKHTMPLNFQLDDDL